MIEPWTTEQVKSYPATRYGAVRMGALPAEATLQIARELMAAENPLVITSYLGRKPEAVQAFEGAHAMPGDAFLDLVEGFVDMHVYRYFELRGQSRDLFEGLVGHRVGGVRGEAETQQRVTAQFVADRQALGKVVVGIGGITGGELDGDDAENRAHSDPFCCRGGSPGKKIHVVEGGDAAAQHFCAGQQGARLHEIRRGMARFGRPDTLRQPAHQGQVVGIAAQQAHGGVGVKVDQAARSGPANQASAAG